MRSCVNVVDADDIERFPHSSFSRRGWLPERMRSHLKDGTPDPPEPRESLIHLELDFAESIGENIVLTT